MVVIIMIVTVQQTAVTLVRERDQGTLEQLIVSPIRRGELMVGKVAPWVVLGVPRHGRSSRSSRSSSSASRCAATSCTLAVATFLFVLCCLALGLLISSRASSPEVANFMALMVSFLPGFMLSGFAFPLNSHPAVPAVRQLPLPGSLHDGDHPRASSSRARRLAELWPQVAALAVYAVVSLSLASRRPVEKAVSDVVVEDTPHHVEGVPAALAGPAAAAASSSSCRCCSSSCSATWWARTCATCRPRSSTTTRPAASRDLVSAIASSGYFTVVDHLDDERELQPLMDASQVQVALIVPRGFAEQLSRGGRVPVELDRRRLGQQDRVGRQRLRGADHRRVEPAAHRRAGRLTARVRASTRASACCSTRRSAR